MGNRVVRLFDALGQTFNLKLSQQLRQFLLQRRLFSPLRGQARVVRAPCTHLKGRVLVLLKGTSVRAVREAL